MNLWAFSTSPPLGGLWQVAWNPSHTGGPTSSYVVVWHISRLHWCATLPHPAEVMPLWTIYYLNL